jgi:hypothetical protein
MKHCHIYEKPDIGNDTDINTEINKSLGEKQKPISMRFI